MINEAANAVSAQAEVVAKQAKANPEAVNEAAFKKLEKLCKQLEEACK